MKIRIYLLCFILPFITACEGSLLDTTPTDRLTSDVYWESENDARLAANAIYPYLEGTNIFFWDAISDIARPNVPFSEFGEMLQGQIDPATGKVSSEWDDAYRGIRATNYFLENVDKVETITPGLIEGVIGEVKVLRAYLYIKLAMVFGDVPLLTQTISIDEGETVTRTSVEEIWDFIEDELESAANDLPEIQEENGRITKGAALALKSRAMLYAERYESAADAAERVMESEVYDLYPSYENLFSYTAENNVEVILDRQYVRNEAPNPVFQSFSPYSQGTSGSSQVPVAKMIDAYEMNNGEKIDNPASGFDPDNPYENRDPRLRYSVFVLGDELPDGTIYDPRPGSGTADATDHTYLSTITGYNYKKYINAEDLNDRSNGGINIILIRFAEVLLNYAEAKIELNQIDQSVYNAINKIRQRSDVDMPIVEEGMHSQDELRSILRHERMVELAFEGFRYFDIIRWEIAHEVLQGPTMGMTYRNEEGEMTTLIQDSFIRNFDPARNYLWPIPLSEVTLNKELEQNPGWGN